MGWISRHKATGSGRVSSEQELKLCVEVASLRADLTEFAFSHNLRESLRFLLQRLHPLFPAETTFCVDPTQVVSEEVLYWPGGEVTFSSSVLGSLRRELAQNAGVVLHQLGNKHLAVVPLSKEARTPGFIGMVSDVPLSSQEQFALEDLGLSVGRVVKMKQSSEIKSHIVKAMDSVHEMVVITDLEGNIEYVNPAFEKMTGYTRDEALGSNPRMLKSGHHDAGFYEELWGTLLDGRCWQGEMINRRKDGTLSHEESSISPILNSEGEPIKYFCVKRDVSEKRSLQKQLWQSQKMETIGILAGGIAHDYNNALGVILGFAELASEEIQEREVVEDALIEIKKAAIHSAAVTSQLLAFARKQLIVPVKLCLGEAITGMFKMLQHLLGARVSLKLDICEKEAAAFLDPNQLSQIMINLCLNARDAIDGSGVIRVRVTRHRFGPEDIARSPYLKEGEFVKVSVQDDGCGMSEAIQDRIFEPFFTTKADKGNGLGMATVYGIVKQNDGFIEVQSQEGKGTEIFLYFPLLLEEATAMSQGESNESPERLDFRVLLVDDDAGMLRITRKMLERIGGSVTAASSIREASQRIQSSKETWDLLLTDVVLPDGTGPALWRRFRDRWPSNRVLFVSGYTKDALQTGDAEQWGGQFLMKPFGLQQLRECVSRALCGSATSVPGSSR